MDTSEKDKGICEKYEGDFADRLRFLRNRSGISAREMSLALGQNVNYINLIENGKRMPSLQGFFAICEQFGITPAEFFAFDAPENELQTALSALTAEQQDALLRLVQVFKL